MQQVSRTVSSTQRGCTRVWQTCVRAIATATGASRRSGGPARPWQRSTQALKATRPADSRLLLRHRAEQPDSGRAHPDALVVGVDQSGASPAASAGARGQLPAPARPLRGRVAPPRARGRRLRHTTCSTRTPGRSPVTSAGACTATRPFPAAALGGGWSCAATGRSTSRSSAWPCICSASRPVLP
jgi:hypothetical protein